MTTPRPYPIRILVLHDDAQDVECLERLLSEQPDVEMVLSEPDEQEPLSLLRTHAPDVAFLGFLPGGWDPFEILDDLPEDERPGVVFISPFKDQALKAFDYGAIDFILTPLSPERLTLTMKRVREAASRSGRILRLPEPGAVRSSDGLEASVRTAYLDRLLIRAKDRLYLVRMKDVDWIEAAADYVHVYSGGRKYILRAKIGDLEKRLDPSRFARIHRSTIVRIDRISELRPMYHGDYQVVLIDRTELTLSRGYKNRFSLFVQNAI